jgi:hypothetical protein
MENSEIRVSEKEISDQKSDEVEEMESSSEITEKKLEYLEIPISTITNDNRFLTKSCSLCKRLIRICNI